MDIDSKQSPKPRTTLDPCMENSVTTKLMCQKMSTTERHFVVCCYATPIMTMCKACSAIYYCRHMGRVNKPLLVKKYSPA